MKQKIKSNKVLNFILVAVALVGVVFGSGFLVSNVYAGDAGGVQKKWAWALYHQCIQDGKYFPTIESKSNGNKILDEVFDKNGTYYLPSYKYGHTSSKASLNCRENMEGASGWSGAMQGNSSTTWKDPSGAKSLLNGLEYNLDESSQEAYFTIQATEYIRYQNIGIGLSGEWGEWHENEASTVVVTITPNDSGGKTYKYSDSVGNFFNDMSIKFENHNMTLKVDSNWVTTLAGNICTVPSGQSETFALKNDPQEFRNDVNSVMTNRTWTVNCTMSSGYTSTNTERRYNFSASTVNMAGGGSYKFRANDNQATTRYTYANLVSQQYGGATLKNMNLTDTERYNLYLHYLQSTVPAGVQNRLTTSPTDKTNLTKVRLKAEDGEFKDFYANYNGSSPSSFSVYTLNDYYFNADSSKHYPKVVSITMADVISWFNSVDTSKLGEVDLTADEGGPTPDPTPTPNPDNPDNPSEPSVEEKCYAESKSLGWIICPVIFGLREMTEKFYTAVEPLIMTNSSIVGELGDSSSGLYEAWATFRGFANILFVIFFMMVIFSQLTGFGIDNYGIKKMLPKLIITAILVNLSFWICGIAVDVSNIVGVGIKNLLEGIGNNIFSTFGANSADAVGYLGDRATGWVTGAVTGAVAVGVGFALEGWALIIPVLLFLLTMVIAIFFALIILGLRQALVVILIVLAPLALACTVLPNTEGLYKKWFGAAKGILMVFPIAAGIIGAGYLTASILMNADDGFIMTIVSGVLMVGPYFMIPSLTQKALDAVSNVGSKVSNFGRGLGSRAKTGINNTDAVRNAKAGSKDLNRRLGAGLYMKTFGKSTGAKIAAGKKVRKGSAERYARNAQIAGSRSQANIAARQAQSQYKRLQGSGFDAAMSAAAMNEDATTTKNWETMLAAGDYSYDTGQVDADGKAVMQKVDSQNNNQIAAALEHELMQKGDKYDANKVRALSNALAAKGKEGRNLMYNTVSNAQKNGASAQAVKDFSGNIMNNHAGTMKEKARSLYEFAKNTADAEIDSNGNVVAQYQKNKDGTDKLVNGQKVLAAGYTQDSSGKVSLSNVESFAAAGTGSLTAGDMTSMDKQQLQRYADNASGDTLKTLGTLANQALTDDHLSQNLSKDNRTLLETIRTNATKAGYNVGAGSMQGRSENFHDRSNTQPKLVSDETRQKIADNGRLNPEVERAIKEVENPAPKNIVVPGQNNNNGGQSSLIDPKTGRPFGA